jgi:hypothetical protein
MDIGSKQGFPAGALSNFSPHPFELDGVRCASMEGFLQSLKFKEPDVQAQVCTLVGFAAKHRGKPKKWWETQTLYWRGVGIKRDSPEYQLLLDRAYQAMYDQSDSFRRALAATHDAVLTHSIGTKVANRTVLTEREFCRRLERLRDQGYLIRKEAV